MSISSKTKKKKKSNKFLHFIIPKFSTFETDFLAGNEVRPTTCVCVWVKIFLYLKIKCPV